MIKPLYLNFLILIVLYSSCDDRIDAINFQIKKDDVKITKVDIITIPNVTEPNLVIEVRDNTNSLFQSEEVINTLPPDDVLFSVEHRLGLVDFQYQLLIYNRTSEGDLLIDLIPFNPDEARCARTYDLYPKRTYRTSSSIVKVHYEWGPEK